jgi:hypothetical protein
MLMTPFVSSCNSRSPRKDLETRDGLDEFVWVKNTEDRTLHDDALCAGWWPNERGLWEMTTRPALRKDPRCALWEQAVSAGLETNDDAHDNFRSLEKGIIRVVLALDPTRVKYLYEYEFGFGGHL